jgi:hypothetical protein
MSSSPPSNLIASRSNYCSIHLAGVILTSILWLLNTTLFAFLLITTLKAHRKQSEEWESHRRTAGARPGGGGGAATAATTGTIELMEGGGKGKPAGGALGYSEPAGGALSRKEMKKKARRKVWGIQF